MQPVEVHIRSSSVTDPKVYVQTAVQDIGSIYNHAMTQRPIRVQRLLVVARMIEDLLATMLVGLSRGITSTRQPDGTNRYDQDVIGEFTSRDNELRRSLGSAQVQTALEAINNIMYDILGSQISQRTIQEFKDNYAIAYPALKAAAANCQNMAKYGDISDVDYNERGPAFAMTSI